MLPTGLITHRLRRRRLLSAAAAATTVALLKTPRRAIVAQTAPVRVVLSNGLTVLVEERPTTPTVALQLVARAGSRDDGDLPGLNSMTSRVLFQGTARRPSETDLQRAVARVGGTLGRGAGAESSTLSSVVPWRETDLAFDLLADIVRNPLFDPDALARQKGIALQDLAQRRANPGALIGDLFQAAMFAGHPLAIPDLGTPETIEALTREALLANHAARWTGANLVLAVVGRISAEEAVSGAQGVFGGLPAGVENRRDAVKWSGPGAARTVRGQVGQQQSVFRLGFPTPGLRDPDRYPLTVLNALTGGPAGWMFRELRTVRGLAYSAGSGFPAFSDAGAWFVSAGVDPENLAAALEVVSVELRRLRDELPDAGDIASRISQIVGGQILAVETNIARAGQIASGEALGTPPVDEVLRRIREVTPAEVQRIARTYLDPDRALLVVVGPGGDA